jgi:hypothetical protein
LLGFCKGGLKENLGDLNICGSMMHTYILMFILESEVSDFGPHGIKGLQLQTHTIQRECNVYYPE